MTATVEEDRLILTAVWAPGKGCNGHMGPIPGGAAYEDQKGFLWCIACAKHMTSCADGMCGHPRAVFQEHQPQPSATMQHAFDPLPPGDQPSRAPEGGYGGCGWHKGAQVHQTVKAA